jgi:hypothetical protein
MPALGATASRGGGTLPTQQTRRGYIAMSDRRRHAAAELLALPRRHRRFYELS